MAFLGRTKAILETLSTLLVIAAASALLWTVFVREGGDRAARAAAPPPVQYVRDTIAAEFVRNVAGSGPLAIVEFTDFQCPFCARHATQTVPELKKALNGKARYVVVNLPLPSHPYAIGAAEAAECAAEQGKYWEFHDALFARQPEIAALSLAAVAAGLGLDTGAFDACLRGDAALARVSADAALAARLEVKTTPTVFVGRMRSDGGVDLLRQINGARPAETFVTEVTKLSKG